MQKVKGKTMAILITIFLTLSMTASMMLIPTTSAHTPAWQIPTHAYIQARPNPVGVGQSAIIYVWIDKVFPGAEPGNDIRPHNYKLIITAPDGTNTTQTWAVVADPTSNQGYSFTPTQVGTYTLTFTYPGQVYTWTEAPVMFGGLAPAPYAGDTFLPSSASTTLTVQSSPTGIYPVTPLPTQYWTRPIYGENPNWYTISSNWLGTGAPGYLGGYYGWDVGNTGETVGPLTSHVMWTKPLQSGGVVGGNNFQIAGDTYFEGSAYLPRFSNPIILDGMLYYTEPLSYGGVPSAFSPQPYGPTVCVDLQTGKQIWSSTSVPALSFGLIFDVQDQNEHGVFPPMLIATSEFGSEWMAFDADTGTPLFNVTNVPTGATAMGPNGEYLIYVLANDGIPTKPQYYLSQWNSSNLWDGLYSGGSTSPTVVPPITDGSNPSMFDWNVSIPSLDTMPVTPSTLQAFYGNMLICMQGAYPTGASETMGIPSDSPYTYIGLNLNATRGAVGTVMWKNTVNPPTGNLTVSYNGADPTADYGAGVFTEYYVETMQYVGYSMATGQKIWGPSGNQVAMDYYNWMAQRTAIIAYGNIYTDGVGGILYCYSLTNGNLMWTYGNGGEGNNTNSGLAYPGQFSTSVIAVGNGVVYLVTSQHQVETPIFKGALARAVNATTGKEIWTLSDDTNSYFAVCSAIADGFETFFNSYDNQIYVVGRGPSATTVSTPHAGLSFGQPLVISGTVMDISAGTTQAEQAADFPYGVPCASDASMTQWMGYVYQQQPEPTNFTGVPVTISVTDSNGNHYNIGTVTTDESGAYSLTWTPIIPGSFTVYANFAGTNGYWPSSAEDHFTVMQAPVSTPAPTATPTSVANTYFVPAITGLFVLIIIVAIVLALLMLRKRP